VPEADDLVAKPNADKQTFYTGACIYSVSSAAPGVTAEQAERYAVRAMELLRRAVDKGYKDLMNLKKDKDLDALRLRDEFRKLLTELEAKSK
jgi:hypothetical protein